MLLKSLGFLFLFPGLAFASPIGSWTSSAIIDLTKVKTATDLAEELEVLTMEMGVDGEDENGNRMFCSYRSIIKGSTIEKKNYIVTLGFEVSGDHETCGDGLTGVTDLWTDAGASENVSMGELVRD